MAWLFGVIGEIGGLARRFSDAAFLPAVLFSFPLSASLDFHIYNTFPLWPVLLKRLSPRVSRVKNIFIMPGWPRSLHLSIKQTEVNAT